MADLKTNLLGFTMNSPIIGASGTVGYGVEYEELADFSKIGGISGKGLTLYGQYGNKGERLWETPSGLINSIGLQNPGVQHFIDVELSEMLELKQKYGTVAIANLGGHSEEEYVEGAAMLSESGVDIVELNISCPNVKVGGMAYGVKAEAAGEVVRMVRDACKKPLMVKLSPQAENIPAMCKAVEAAGADAISLTNTFQACAIDLEKRRPVFDNIFAGLSGPAVRPIALRMVWQAVGAVNIPVVGLGGIATGRDARDPTVAGAAAAGKRADEASALAQALLASLNEHSGVAGKDGDAISKALQRFMTSGTEATFSTWLATSSGMASGTLESIFTQYTDSLLALADRLYTKWESSGTSMTFPAWLDAQQVSMENLSETAEEPDTDTTDESQTTEAPEDVPDGQESEGQVSGNSIWEIIGTAVRENPIIVWSIVAVVAALVIVGAVRRYHKVKRDERDDNGAE